MTHPFVDLPAHPKTHHTRGLSSPGLFMWLGSVLSKKGATPLVRGAAKILGWTVFAIFAVWAAYGLRKDIDNYRAPETLASVTTTTKAPSALDTFPTALDQTDAFALCLKDLEIVFARLRVDGDPPGLCADKGWLDNYTQGLRLIDAEFNDAFSQWAEQDWLRPDGLHNVIKWNAEGEPLSVEVVEPTE